MSLERRESKPALAGEREMLGTEGTRRVTGVTNIFFKKFLTDKNLLLDLFCHLSNIPYKKNIFIWELWEDDQYA